MGRGLLAPDLSVLSYLIVGVPMGTVWHSVFFGIASGLSSEIWGGTIEFTMIPRTPMVVALEQDVISYYDDAILTTFILLFKALSWCWSMPTPLFIGRQSSR
jgi:hypothetical protein